MRLVIKDADNYAEYCLECIRKHLDTAFVNLGEIEQRLIYKPEPDKKVRLKVESIIADLEAAEQHALDNTQTTEPEKLVLGELTTALRQTRKLLEMTKLGYRSDQIKPVGGLADIQLAKKLIDGHREQCHVAIAEIGCGDCDTAEAQLSLIVMRKQLKKKLPSKTIIDLMIQEKASNCQTEPEPDECVLEAAEEIRDFKIERNDPVIPTTTQLVERITLEMNKTGEKE